MRIRERTISLRAIEEMNNEAFEQFRTANRARWGNPDRRELFVVYTLEDPETGIVHYVGCSSCPHSRRTAHFRPKGQARVNQWVNQLRVHQQVPRLKILRIGFHKEMATAEMFFIRKFSRTGCLLNVIHNERAEIRKLRKKQKKQYTWTALRDINEKIPHGIMEAMDKEGWNVFGIYELVKERLAKKEVC